MIVINKLSRDLQIEYGIKPGEFMRIILCLIDVWHVRCSSGINALCFVIQGHAFKAASVV